MKRGRRSSSDDVLSRQSTGDRRSSSRIVVRTLLVVLLVVIVVGGGLAYSLVRRGLSTHAQPSFVEEAAARTMRRLATPAAVRARPNPVASTSDILDAALSHYADHCAACHANDGSGDTAIGRGLYPKVPDMRLSKTQSLSDGELFSIIEHGIRLTGMPGWGTGTPDGERESWGLVHFIRSLPRLSQADIERVGTLTPRTPAQLREEEETRRFLAGEKPAASGSAPSPKGDHR